MYVSRQTISNWENNKSYPDIHNLLLMCNLFSITLNELIVRDIENPQLKIDKKELTFWTWIMLILMILGAILIGPLIYYLS